MDLSVESAKAALSAKVVADIRERARWAWRVVWRGKHLLLACWLLVLIPTVLYLAQATPRYTADVKIIIEGPEATEAFYDRTSGRVRLTEGTVLTEAEVMSSNVIVRKAIEKLGLAEDPEFNTKLRKPKALESILGAVNPLAWIARATAEGEREAVSSAAREEIALARITQVFKRNFKVLTQRRAFVVNLSFISEDREKAAKIANTLAELYVTDRLEAGFEDARRVTGWLGDRLEVLRRDVSVAETASEQYRAANNLRRRNERSGERAGTMTDQQLSELSSRLVVARTELAQKQARLDQIRSLIRSQGNVETAVDVLQSQLIQRLREQETVLLREMSEASRTYGERHPKIIASRADLTELRTKIAHEIEKIAISIANEVEVGQAGVRTLEREVDNLQRQTNTASGAEIRLRELERQAEASRSLYESFLARFKRDAEQEKVQRANARIISPATIPAQPSEPHRLQILSLATMAGLVIGVVMIFLLDRLDNAIRSSDEAEELTRLPVLAMVPIHRNRAATLAEDLALHPRSALADSIRSLRVTLDVGDATERPRVLAVTSSVPKEGKTFVTLCLAGVLAKSGERVVLVDGDLHRPRLDVALGVNGDRGLAQILAGEAAPAEVVQSQVIEGVDFIPAGRMDHVADLINEQQIEALVRTLSGHYDRIIFDSPPVLAVSDARILARCADCVLYLVKWNHTPRDAIRNGMKLLREAHVQPHGVVLTQVNQRKHARYAYGDYGQYYGRYKEYYGD